MSSYWPELHILKNADVGNGVSVSRECFTMGLVEASMK